MAVEWSATSWGCEKMIEQAKEELQILESHHPNRFDYLKLELRSFISLLQSQNSTSMFLSNNTNNNIISSPNSTVTTQASSTSKKRKKGSSCEMQRTMEEGGEIKARKQKFQKADDDCDDESFYGKSRDRIELVIERAKTCLRKIQQFKTSFYSY